MEEKNNGHKDIKFKYFLSIGVLEDGTYAVQTNAPDKVVGYGLCEVAKSGVDNHIANLMKSNIVKPKGNLMDFLRRR